MILVEFMMKLPFRRNPPLTQPLLHLIDHTYWWYWQLQHKDSV